MSTLKSLLVATDFSVDGNNAVRRAALLAHAHGAHVHILHVLKTAGCKPLRDWFSPTTDIDLKAAQALDALRRVTVEIASTYDVKSSVEVRVGDPFETLLQASERADLVVLGRRGHGRLKGLLVGRTVDRMLRTCKRPVLVVKTPVTQPYRRILVPIDFTSSSDAAIRVAATMRSETGLRVFHAINSQREAVLRDTDVPEHIISETRMMEEAGTNARMRRKIARLGLDSKAMSFALAHGPAVRSTLRHAQKFGADLIVAAKQGRSSVGSFLLGSVSSRMLTGSNCDMLIVPKPRDESPPHAVLTLTPALVLPARAGHAGHPANAESSAAQPGPLGVGHWMNNTARFLPRNPF